MKETPHIRVIGIDPGTKTGMAIKDLNRQKFLSVDTLSIHEAMDMVKAYTAMRKEGVFDLYVVVEDARQRQWIPKETGREVLQGVGSVKRDCAIWDDYLASLGIPYRMVAPAAHRTKWSQALWQAATGWERCTSEHARDAAILVHGLNLLTIQKLNWK